MTKVALTTGLSRRYLISQALKLIDEDIGQQLRVKDPCTVLIKPNMVKTSVPLAATHADALRAVLDYLQKYDDHISKIVIGEGPAGSPAQEGFENYGYLRLAKEYPVDFMDLNRDSHIKAKISQIDKEDIEVRIARTSLESDYKISVTVPKTHETVIYTGATKNFIMGSVIWDDVDDKIKIHGFEDRSKWDIYYSRAIKIMHRNLLKLAKLLKPDLSVIDGFVAMEGNGPVKGTPLNLRVAASGTDPIATDAVAAHVMGFNPSDIGYLYYSNREGIGTAELSEINILGSKISDLRKTCKPHKNHVIEKSWKLDLI